MPVAAAIPMVQQPPPRRLAGRPTCTHLVMDKIYGGDHACQLCNRVPAIGWVYVCQQDNLPLPDWNASSTLKPRKQPSNKSKHRSITTELELLGFNKSIIKAAEAGHYTHAQFETLKEQKRHVRAAIDAALDDNELLKSKNGPSATVLSEKLAALEVSTSKTEPDERKQTLVKDDKSTRKAKSRPISKSLQPCEFRVCHTCRPFSRDRSFISFEAIRNEEVALPRQWVPEFMPVADSKVLRYMTWEEEDHFYESEEHDFDDAVESNLHQNERTRSPSTAGFRSSLEQSFHSLLDQRRSDDSVAAVYHSHKNGEFDLDLWKKMMARVQNEAAAKRLPGKDSDSSLGKLDAHGHMEEEHVDGGVALTEEAVETRSPDIIMSA